MSSNLIWSWDFSEISDALFLLSFFLSCLLSCFQCVEKSSRSDCPICYEVRATLLFLDQTFCLGHTTGFKKVIIMASPVFSPSKQKPGCFPVLLVLTLCFCHLCLLTKISLFFSCTLCRTATNNYYVKCLLFSTVF